MTIAYTQGLNLLNYSVVVIPVTKADKRLNPIDRDYNPRGKSDRSNWETYKSHFMSIDQGIIRAWNINHY